MEQILKIDKVFHRNNVLHDINLAINKGEIATIIGPNGCGKTSLMKILAGIIKPDYGTVKYSKNVKISYMPQSINFDKTFSINGYDFITLSKYKIDKNKLKEVIDLTGISNLLKQQLFHISGGELQKLLLAKSLVVTPEIMILDEPVSAMDVFSREKFYEIIKSESIKNSCTIIMASHDVHVVMNKSNKIFCLNHKLCCEGNPNDIVNDEKFIEMFGNNVGWYKHSHIDNA